MNCYFCGRKLLLNNGLLALLLIMMAGTCSAEVATIEIDENSRNVPGIGAISYFEIPDGTLSLEDISQLPSSYWTHSRDSNPSLGFTEKEVWFSFKLSNFGNSADFILLSDFSCP